MASTTSAIDSYNSFYDGIKLHNLTVMQELVLAKEVQYFIGGVDNHFVLAEKKEYPGSFSQATPGPCTLF